MLELLEDPNGTAGGSPGAARQGLGAVKVEDLGLLGQALGL